MSATPNKADPQPLAAVAGAQGAQGAPAAEPVKAPPNKRVIGIVAVIALIAIGVGGRMWYRSHFYVETENAFVSGHVTPVSSRVPGVVTKVLVEDNQVVAAGAVIAELDPADQRVKVEQIQAQIASAEQQVLQADATIAQTRAQASAAQSQVVQSQAALQRSKQDADRFGQLYNTQMKAVSKAELDAANAARAGATADVAARRENVVAAQAQITAAQSQKEVLKAQVKVLQTQLKDARQTLGYNQVIAPVAGRIGKRSVEVGARVQPGQQLAAIVQEDLWVTANFKETQLAELTPGQQVHIEIDALPKHPLAGRLDSFSPASGNQFALLPADNATGNFTKIVQRVPVKITLRPEDVRALSGRLAPGMSALVEIKLNSDANEQVAAKPAVAAAAH